MWDIRFGSRVKIDIDNGYLWYEQQQNGLGNRFLSEVQNKIDSILSNPEAYGSRAKRNYREGKVDHFPYLIVYRVDKEDHTIYITSIHHTKKHPRAKYKK